MGPPGVPRWHRLMCSRGGRGEGALWGLLCKNAEPIHDLIISHLLAPSPLGGRISTYEFGGDTDIQSITAFKVSVILVGLSWDLILAFFAFP